MLSLSLLCFNKTLLHKKLWVVKPHLWLWFEILCSGGYESQCSTRLTATTFQYFEHSFALPFFEIFIKTDLLQSCGHCWVFQICWHIERSTFKASSFRIWNSSAGILLPPLAVFIVMLPKTHLISHSKMSGSRQQFKCPVNDIFFYLSHRMMKIKIKINKRNLPKLKNFCTAMETIKQKGNPQLA